MEALDLIVAKREGESHPPAAIDALVRGVVDGSIPDYQLAAWLMAVVWRGMTVEETAALADAMARSGRVLDQSALPAPTADKHSTGGVGDKTSLVALPLAAASGLTVAKMSGRGLGHTGGTLDKLESVPGLRVDLAPGAFLGQAARIGLAITGQTADLAPADQKLYALRDATGTFPSQALIAASIMCKKLAAGAEAIALDVKVGRGALLPSEDEARGLAALMVEIGRRLGRPTVAALTRMDQPLGRAVGNALELREAILALQDRGPDDLQDLSLTITGLMHVAANQARRPEDIRGDLELVLRSGRGLERLRAMIEAQGGDPRVCDHPDSVLPKAPIVAPVLAPEGGWVAGLDARTIGEAAMALGAGRRRKGEAIDPAVGIVLRAKAGDRVSRGTLLAELHARTNDAAEEGRRRVLSAYSIRDDAEAARAPEPLLVGYIM